MSIRTVRRALVTGASGFVGTALCAALSAQEVDVVASARDTRGRRGHSWVRMDLPDDVPREAVEGVDTVFHLAGRAHAVATTGQDAALFDRVNREGTRAVASAAAAAGAERFVLFSSVKAMRPPGSGVVSEDDDAPPCDPYGTSKRAAEREVFEVGRQTGMEVVVLRPALVYGTGMKGNLAALLDSLRRGRRPPLPLVDNRRSLVSVDDLVRCAISAAEHAAAPGKTYVVTDGEVYSTNRIVRALAAAAGVDPTPRLRPPIWALRVAARAGDAVARVTSRPVPLDTPALQKLLGNAEYECRRARAELGFEPRHTLESVAAALTVAPAHPH